MYGSLKMNPEAALKPFGSSSESKEPEADYEAPGRRSGPEDPEAV